MEFFSRASHAWLPETRIKLLERAGEGPCAGLEKVAAAHPAFPAAEHPSERGREGLLLPLPTHPSHTRELPGPSYDDSAVRPPPDHHQSGILQVEFWLSPNIHSPAAFFTLQHLSLAQ